MRIFIVALLLCLAMRSSGENVTRVSNIPMSQTSYPVRFYTYNGMLYFTGLTDGQVHLLKTDGSGIVQTVGNTAFDFVPQNFIVYNNQLYFTAYNQLYSTDGQQIYPQYSFGTSAEFHNFAVYNDKLVFMVNTDIWVADAAAQTTQKLQDMLQSVFSNTSGFAIFNNKIFFGAGSVPNNRELWVSDLTSSGTHMVKDIYPGGSGEVSNLLEYNGRLYFSAENEPVSGGSIHHYKPWSTDGTDTGTHLLKDVNPSSRFPIDFMIFNNKLFFTVQDFSQNYTLFAGDGTTQGTDTVATITNPDNYCAYDGKIYFSSGISGSPALWVCDGTAPGTFQFMPNSLLKDPGCLTVYNNTLYFTAKQDASGYELWKSDGTLAGTTKFSFPNLIQYNPLATTVELYEYKNGLYFIANFDGTGFALWRLDPFPTDIPFCPGSIEVQVYPNPNDGTFTIQLPQKGMYDVSIINITGATVYHAVLPGEQQHLIEPNRQLPSGTYILQLKGDNGIKKEQLLQVR